MLDETESLVVDDTVTTAGAALAHLDLALAIVRKISPTLAEAIGDYLAVGDRPSQGDHICPALLVYADPLLARFDRAARDRIDQPVDIGELAADLGVSTRTPQRVTATNLGMTPVRFVQQLRLERAVDLLRTTDLSVAMIARLVGYQHATTSPHSSDVVAPRPLSKIRRRRLTTSSTWTLNASHEPCPTSPD